MFFLQSFCFSFFILPISSKTSLPTGILSQLTGAPACGYQQQGSLLNIGPSIQVCLPPVYCNPETCPPRLGKCVNGQCQYIAPYNGLATFPTAEATYYCTLDTGGCNGALGGSIFDMAKNASASLKLPLCQPSGTGDCVGIAATSPMLMGNSQIAHIAGTTNYVPLWGLGLTYASGLCYQLTGPNGRVTVAITDRCAGYCRCDGSYEYVGQAAQAAFHECGEQMCYDSPALFPNQPCVGILPQIGYSTCAGNGCGGIPMQKCDWCTSNSHAHFDVDNNAFANLCGETGSSGHCDISSVTLVPCDVGLSPPSPSGGGGGGGGGVSVPPNAYNCNGTSPSPSQPLIPGTTFCCNWGFVPNINASCVSSSSMTTPTPPANSYNCNGVSPGPSQPLIPGTSYCCSWGKTLISNGCV